MIDIFISIFHISKKIGLWIFKKVKNSIKKDYNHISSFISKHPLKSLIFLIILLNFIEAFIVSSYKQKLGSQYYWNYQSEPYGEICLRIMVEVEDKTLESNNFDVFKKLEEDNSDILLDAKLLTYFFYVDNKQEYEQVLKSIIKAKNFCSERVKKIGNISTNKWFIPALMTSSIVGIEIISPNLLPLIDLRKSYEFYIFAILLILPYIILSYYLINRAHNHLSRITIFAIMALSWLGSFAPFFILS